MNTGFKNGKMEGVVGREGGNIFAFSSTNMGQILVIYSWNDRRKQTDLTSQNIDGLSTYKELK